MHNVSNPIIIDQFYCDSQEPCANQVLEGNFKLHFHQVQTSKLSSSSVSLFSFVVVEMQTSAVKVENISFVRIHGTSASDEAIRFACSDTSPCESLYLEDIHLVPYTGKHVTKSFCWEAYGSSSGPLHPPPCFPSEDTSIMPGSSHDSLVTSI